MKRFLKWIRNWFDAAHYSTKRSRIYGSRQDAKMDLNPGTRKELVRKSRNYDCNGSIPNRMADLFEQFTVGADGLQIIPASSDPEWNRRAADWNAAWAESPDLSSWQTWQTLQSIVARRWFFDGEIAILKAFGRGADGVLSPKVQLIEEHRIETPKGLESHEGKDIIDGVRVDENGKPVGYYIRVGDSKDPVYSLRDARSLRHVFEPSRPGQYRGLPFLAPVLNDLNDLDDLEGLEMDAAKENAHIANVIKSQTGEIPAGLLRRARLTGQTIDSLGNNVSDDRIGHYQEVLGGRTIALFPGESLDQHRSDRPSVASFEFWERKDSKICAGVGIPKMLVFPGQKGQGTQIRGEYDIANGFFRSRSAVLASHFIDIWRWAMEWAIRTQVSLSDPPADWKRVMVRAPRSVNVDIGRNSTAMLAELKAGATNYDLIYGPLGLDPVEQLRRSAFYARLIRDLATEFEVTPAEIADYSDNAIDQQTQEMGLEQEQQTV